MEKWEKNEEQKFFSDPRIFFLLIHSVGFGNKLSRDEARERERESLEYVKTDDRRVSYCSIRIPTRNPIEFPFQKFLQKFWSSIEGKNANGIVVRAHQANDMQGDFRRKFEMVLQLWTFSESFHSWSQVVSGWRVTFERHSNGSKFLLSKTSVTVQSQRKMVKLTASGLLLLQSLVWTVLLLFVLW